MVQAVMFGVGAVLVLATPLDSMAMQLMPWVVGVSAVGARWMAIFAEAAEFPLYRDLAAAQLRLRAVVCAACCLPPARVHRLAGRRRPATPKWETAPSAPDMQPFGRGERKAWDRLARQGQPAGARARED